MKIETNKSTHIVDTEAETHRKASDCTCYSCMKKETRNYINTNNDVLEQEQNGQRETQSETGRVS